MLVARGLGKGGSGRILVTFGLGLNAFDEPPVPPPSPYPVAMSGQGAPIGGAWISRSDYLRRRRRHVDGLEAPPLTSAAPAPIVDARAIELEVDAASPARRRRRRDEELATLLLLLTMGAR